MGFCPVGFCQGGVLVGFCPVGFCPVGFCQCGVLSCGVLSWIRMLLVKNSKFCNCVKALFKFSRYYDIIIIIH